MFQNYSTTTYWKIELLIETIVNNVKTNGSNELILKTNQLPYNGTCLLSNLTGYALDTYFIINCTEWIDDDGYIILYEFYGKLLIKIIN